MLILPDASASAGLNSSNVPMSESDQVSLEEFLESCRATSLLAELEDDEELPDAEDEDNDEDNDNEEEDDYEENYDEDGFEGVVASSRYGIRYCQFFW